MKVELLQHLSGEKVHHAGEEIEVSDPAALRMIQKGIAKAKAQKDHDALIKRVEKTEKEEAEKQAKLIAVQKEQELKDEAESLLDQLLAIVAALDSAIPGYKQDFLEAFHAKFVKEESKK